MNRPVSIVHPIDQYTHTALLNTMIGTIDPSHDWRSDYFSIYHERSTDPTLLFLCIDHTPIGLTEMDMYYDVSTQRIKIVVDLIYILSQARGYGHTHAVINHIVDHAHRLHHIHAPTSWSMELDIVSQSGEYFHRALHKALSQACGIHTIPLLDYTDHYGGDADA